MSEPTTTNTLPTVVNEILKIAIMDVGVNLAKAAATAEVPFLGWPVISQIFGFFLNKVAGYFYQSMAQFATFQIIDEQTRLQRQAYDDSIAAVKAAVELNDQAKIDESTKAFKEKLANLIHWNGEARIP